MKIQQFFTSVWSIQHDSFRGNYAPGDRDGSWRVREMEARFYSSTESIFGLGKDEA